MEPRPDLGNHPRKKARDLMPLRHRSAPKEELQGRLFLADIGGPVRGVQLPCVRQAHEEAELRGVLGRSLPPEGSSSTLVWGSALGFRVGYLPLLGLDLWRCSPFARTSCLPTRACSVESGAGKRWPKRQCPCPARARIGCALVPVRRLPHHKCLRIDTKTETQNHQHGQQ